MAVNVGLDIGTSAIRAAVVRTGKGTPQLIRYGEVALPTGAVSNGEIVDDVAVTEAIRRLWKQAKLPKSRVVVGLANQRVIVRRIDLPAMPESELEESLSFQVQDYIPIPTEDAILDFVPLEEFATPEGEPMMSILAIAAQRDMANDFLSVLSATGIKVMAVDLQAFSLVRAVYGGTLNLDRGADAIVNIGAGLTQIAIVQGGAVRLLRIVPIGGNSFTSVLRDLVDGEAGDAEQVKRRVGVQPDGTADPNRTDGKVREALTRQADVLIEEVRGSIDYHISQSADARVERLLISGNAARLPHLASRMGRGLGLPIEPIRMLGTPRLEVTGKIGLSDEELKQTEPVLPVPVGLALWGEV